ncbi:TIGR04219 family outer membrane beta-barrel protein [Halorhodospira neutriphila]|uniref:Outer membrane protein n=1 Tax=Halorhodospira neutriphila TaxID=168379 RepID=A0ABS1E802_9GAMM|nr:TIGR04219 family outer membrane beta-barrel protein [Halorhodospira neutriphila]MBK1726414.1 hypothetical protein [Halorhodospira neutriphila]
MRRALTTTAAAGLLLSTGAAHATGGILGLSGGVNLWSHDPDGTQKFDGSTFDVEDDLGLDGDEDLNAWLEWDHPVPVIPSIRVERTGLEEQGSGTLNFDYGDISASTSVDSVVELDQTDITLFWSPLPLPYLDVDIGLTGKVIDGRILVESNAQKEELNFSGPLPMAYGRLGLDIPTTRFKIEASTKILSYDGHSITDTQAHLAYKWWYAGAMIGYRDMAVELDDFDDVTIDVSFSGPYAGAFLRF